MKPRPMAGPERCVSGASMQCLKPKTLQPSSRPYPASSTFGPYLVVSSTKSKAGDRRPETEDCFLFFENMPKNQLE
jgi:hypothetical protein